MLCDWNDQRTCYTRLFDIYQMRLEHALWCLEPFRPDLDDTTIRQLRHRVFTQTIVIKTYEDTHSVALHEHSRLLR